jgi:hypothetical protein
MPTRATITLFLEPLQVFCCHPSIGNGPVHTYSSIDSPLCLWYCQASQEVEMSLDGDEERVRCPCYRQTSRLC